MKYHFQNENRQIGSRVIKGQSLKLPEGISRFFIFAFLGNRAECETSYFSLSIDISHASGRPSYAEIPNLNFEVEL